MLIKPKAPVRIEGCRKRCLYYNNKPKGEKCCTLYKNTQEVQKSCASKAAGDKDIGG